MSPKPCYCINPACKRPDHPDNNNPHTRYCLSCGSQLLLNDQFRVSRLLSDDSGFGNVYEVFQGFSAKILKVLKPEWNSEPKAIELFKREYEVLKELSQQGVRGIPQGESYFEYPPQPGLKLYCLVMEKVEGVDLIQWLKNNGKLNQTQALKWLREIVLILDKIHRKNYFHRDIKPPNIMMRNNGELVLIDFGTAREKTQTYYQKLQGRKVTGITSVGYTPIEQQNGEAVAQSDFFALGRTFVHLLTGKEPCDPSIYDPMRDVLNWRGYTENINPLLLNLIDDLMARLAADRPPNTQEILQRLARLEQNLKPSQKPVPPTVPSPPPPKPRSQKPVPPPVPISPPQFPKKQIRNSLIVVGSITVLGLGIVSLRQPSSVVTTSQPTETLTPTNIPKSTPSSVKEITVKIYADQGWQRVIQVERGQLIKISAWGEWSNGKYSDGNTIVTPTFGPDGSNKLETNRFHYLFEEDGVLVGSLIGKIDENKPFMVGSTLSSICNKSGILYLAMNDDIKSLNDNEGFITVKVKLFR